MLGRSYPDKKNPNIFRLWRAKNVKTYVQDKQFLCIAHNCSEYSFRRLLLCGTYRLFRFQIIQHLTEMWAKVSILRPFAFRIHVITKRAILKSTTANDVPSPYSQAVMWMTSGNQKNVKYIDHIT